MMNKHQAKKLALKLQAKSCGVGLLFAYPYYLSTEILGGAIFVWVFATCLASHCFFKKYMPLFEKYGFTDTSRKSISSEMGDGAAREQIDNLGTHSASICGSLGKAYEGYYHHLSLRD